MSDEQNDAAPVAEPTADELLDKFNASMNAAPPVPVIARTPSSEAPTQRKATEDAPPSVGEAVRALVSLIRAHRTIGDSDVDAAISNVEAALASWGT